MTPSAARVSVIVPTKDRCALLAEALASIRRLEGPDLHLELIVADNGSTDCTQAVAREFDARYLHAETRGPAAARNAGICAATGEFLAFLDDDDVWLPTHLRPHIKLLRDDPALTAAIGQVVPADIKLTPSAPAYPTTMPRDGRFFEHFLARWPQIGALVIRRSAIDSIGLLDENLLAGEDWDWHLRISVSGRMAFTSEPSLLFRVRAPGQFADDQANWERWKWAKRVFWSNVARSGERRPSALRLARMHLRHGGAYTGMYLQSLDAHLEAGRPEAARTAFLRAVRISPLHVLAAAARRPLRMLETRSPPAGYGEIATSNCLKGPRSRLRASVPVIAKLALQNASNASNATHPEDQTDQTPRR
jgi:glycosyltransferase involved in cell wall biosynthesis